MKSYSNNDRSKNIKNTKVKPTTYMRILIIVITIKVMTKTDLDENSNKNSSKNNNSILSIKMT